MDSVLGLGGMRSVTAIWFLVILALIFIAVWLYFGRNPGPRAKIGPDGTNVREPETFVVHHEGKGQGVDIANTALKERTEHLRKDLPGQAKQVRSPIPGREMIRMDAPPSDRSKYGAEKVAPGAVPGQPEAESKEKVLTEGPRGSRPESPEEPGSQHAKGRRVTDNHRDVELSAELLAHPFPDQGRAVSRDLAASPATTQHEPGYGLGRTHPGATDGEGGEADDEHANAPGPVEQPEMTDDLPDMPEGQLPMASSIDPQAAVRVDAPAQAPAPVRTRVEAPVHREPPRESRSLPVQDEEIPDSYGEETVVALVRNPRSLYVYWEFPQPEGERWAVSEPSQPVIRIYNLTSGAQPEQSSEEVLTIHVTENDDHWFVNDGILPGHRYVASYERLGADGRYYPIAHSSPVQTPAVDVTAPQWLQRFTGHEPEDSVGSPHG